MVYELTPVNDHFSIQVITVRKEFNSRSIQRKIRFEFTLLYGQTAQPVFPGYQMHCPPACNRPVLLKQTSAKRYLVGPVTIVVKQAASAKGSAIICKHTSVQFMAPFFPTAAKTGHASAVDFGVIFFKTTIYKPGRYARHGSAVDHHSTAKRQGTVAPKPAVLDIGQRIPIAGFYVHAAAANEAVSATA
jgi:hypothetical protein